MSNGIIRNVGGGKSSTPTASNRIGSVDSVRAIILLGIFLVHAMNGFGFRILECIHGRLDSFVWTIISMFLAHKCAIVFNIMFGISFYFMLKKPDYPSSKFVWRCVLLFLFGAFNKLFYTYDALCWYAIWGIVLTQFRNLTPKQLLCSAIILRILAVFIGLLVGHYSLIDYFPENTRYFFGMSFWDLISYPQAYIDYLGAVIGGGLLGGLSNFTIGYCIGKSGLIEKLERVITLKVVLAFLCLYVIFLFSSRYQTYTSSLLSLSAGGFYATCIIYAYYHINFLKPLLRYLEAYGKLGLTNYSAQSVFGVLLLLFYGNKILSYGFTTLVVIVLAFYVLQVVFSNIWLRKFKYGPLEYIWRSLTDKKFSSNRI